MRTEIINTDNGYDAGWLGFDGPTTPSEGGLTVDMVRDERGITFVLNGPDGEVEIDAAVVRYMASRLAVLS